MRKTVTVDYIKAIHEIAVRSTREDEIWISDIVRSEADLQFTSEKLSNTDDVYEQCAIALYNIACLHPFYEGNKRSALLLCENLLEDDQFIIAGENEIYEFVRNVACDTVPIKDIVMWLKKNTGQSLPEQK